MNVLLACPDKNLGPSYFMKSTMWPMERFNTELQEQCLLTMDLTWKYSVLPYIQNALAFESDLSRTLHSLDQFWKEFKEQVFSFKDELHANDHPLSH